MGRIVVFTSLILCCTALYAQKGGKPLYSKEVYFEFNRWDIRPGDEKILQSVARAIKSQKTEYWVKITGHTDNVDNDRYNYQLGLKRAQAVAAYLKKKGADSARFRLFSQGEKIEKHANTTDSLRMLNRRVEILIFKGGPDRVVQNLKLDGLMVDSISQKQLKGQILLLLKCPGDTAEVRKLVLNGSSFSLNVETGCKYEIIFSAKDYRTRRYSDSLKPLKDKSSTISIKAEMVKAKVKRRENLEKIYFVGNSDQILPTSAKDLERLLDIAKEKGVTAIEIVGHVNYPTTYNPADSAMMRYNYDLSFRRARAVYNHLLKVGINKNIMNYKGVSNTEMVYPAARSEDEMQKNRRVEVLILEE